MKKSRVITLSALLAGSLFASGVYVQDGWNLKGADKNLNVSEVPCAKQIWLYDQYSEPKWKLYHKYTNSNNYGYPVVNTINQGQGFWVLGEGCSNNPPVDGNSTDGNMTAPATFHAFDKEWQNRRFFDKSQDPRYLVDGNIIKLNNPIVELISKKKTDVDSRTEMKVVDLKPVNMVEAKVNLKVSTTNFNRGQMNLLFKDASIDSSLSDKTIGISKALVVVSTFVAKVKLFYWITVEDNSGNILWDTTGMDTTIADNLNLVGKDVKLSVKVIPNGVRFDIEDDTNQTYSKEYINTKIGFDAIDSLRFRARVDDPRAKENSVISGDETVFEVLGVETPDVNIKYDENATLPAFSMSNLPTTLLNVNEDDHEGYDKVTVNGTNLSFAWYEDVNGTWTKEEDFGITLTSQTTNTCNYTTQSNEMGTFTKESLKKVLEINGIAYTGTALYEVIAKRETTQQGNVEWEITDWKPERWDINQNKMVVITNINEFLTEALSQQEGMWFGDAKNGGVNMLSATSTTATTGNVVRGVANGTWDGCTDGDCTKYIKTTEVIGQWSLGTDGVLKIDSNESSEVHYNKYESGVFYEGWQSRVGSIEKHRWYFGDDINKVESLIQQTIK